jgi:hypothetical protein
MRRCCGLQLMAHCSDVRYRTYTIPSLDRPFFRFIVDMDDDQYIALREHERAGREVYYVAPCFCDWTEYDDYFQNETILKQSLMLAPNDIEVRSGSSSGQHRVVYDRERSYVCSEPVRIPRVHREQIVGHVRQSIQNAPESLGNAIRIGYESAGRSTDRVELLERLRGCADNDDNVFAALIGLQVWLGGGQLIFVTEGD